MRRVLQDAGKLNEARELVEGQLRDGDVAHDEQSIRFLREAIDLGSGGLAEGHQWGPQLVRNLGLALAGQEKFDEADRKFREALQMFREAFGDEHPQVAGANAQWALALLEYEKFIDAEPIARECLEIREKQIPDNWLTFYARSMLGRSLLGQQRYDEAEPLLLSGYEGMMEREDEIPAQGRPRLQEALEALVQLHEETGRPAETIQWQETLAELESSAGGR